MQPQNGQALPESEQKSHEETSGMLFASTDQNRTGELHASYPGEGVTVVSSAARCFPFHSIRLATRMTLIVTALFLLVVLGGPTLSNPTDGVLTL